MWLLRLFFEYTNFKDALIEKNVYVVKKIINKKLMKNKKNKLFNAIKFSKQYNNRFILFLQKDVCPYEYIDEWEKNNETSSPEEEDFYSHLNMEEITDADYPHTKRVCKGLKIKKLGEYHDFYV